MKVIPTHDEFTPQRGEPILPQPGDTRDTWDPARAQGWPADDACTPTELLGKWMAAEGLTFADLDDRDCRQLVLAVCSEKPGTLSRVCCLEEREGRWAAAEGMERFPGWCGPNGLNHDRREGDNTSPAGLWPLGLCFGTEEKPAGLRMPWRDITPNSDWVGDHDSPYYATWQEWGTPGLAPYDRKAGEVLSHYPTPYALSCVIRFNAPPFADPKKGCAIFFHVSDHPTAGCIGMLKPDLTRVLTWMEPEKYPHILITGVQPEKNGKR